MAAGRIITRGFGAAVGVRYVPTRGFSSAQAEAITGVVDLTLPARSPRLTLETRTLALTLPARTVALTLEDL